MRDVSADEVLAELRAAVLRYVEAEAKLEKVRRLAEELAAKVPEGDWSYPTETTARADAGRAFLRIIQEV